jgi:hypothetical protein
MVMSLEHGDTAVTARWADRELFRYVYLPGDPQLESRRAPRRAVALGD